MIIPGVRWRQQGDAPRLKFHVDQVVRRRSGRREIRLAIELLLLLLLRLAIRADLE